MPQEPVRFSTRNLLIGVDVGGSNTDSVLVDPEHLVNKDGLETGILAWNKTTTTPEVSDGIINGISSLFKKNFSFNKDEVASVTIGTTHFINAVIEQDRSRLSKVAIIRLCGPYTKDIPPFTDFPKGLAQIISGYVCYVNGGYQVDGKEVQPLDENEILEHVAKIEKLGIKSIAIVGTFSSLKKDQEYIVKNLILTNYKSEGVKVVMSHEISGIGFLERENATILNASILVFAERIICSFVKAVKELGLECPVLLTQNDGTVIPALEAIKFPIKTFSSGPTNSMRGASFLSNMKNQACIVLDVGGTTTEFGVLLSSNFPRLSSSVSVVGGVRMNFSMPHVKSIGLGGGSLVRSVEENGLSIGPDSTGSEIVERALVFGGKEITATDVAVAANHSFGHIYNDSGITGIGIVDQSIIKQKFSDQYIKTFIKEVENMLEKNIDLMKTDPSDIIVLAVGGGSFIVPNELKGASKVIKPQFYSVANAIGAAMGKISSEIHTVRYLPPGVGKNRDETLEQLKKEAFGLAIQKGALESSIEIVFVSYDPVPYVNDTYEFIIKTISDVDYAQIKRESIVISTVDKIFDTETMPFIKDSNYENFNLDSTILQRDDFEEADIDYESYKPNVNAKREWLLSITDLEFINIGAYIIGCGGGGNPYSKFLASREYLKKGDSIKVIDVKDVWKHVRRSDEGGSVGSFCNAGSPTVSNEIISSDALIECYETMKKYTGKEIELVFPIEIGGGNGLIPFTIATSSKLNLPVIDCDLMGRAYPTHWQTIPVVNNEITHKPLYLPFVFSNGNKNTMITVDSKSDFLLEKTMRAALSEIGCTVGVMNPPMTVGEVEQNTIHRSISLCWRLGRAVKIAKQRSEIHRIPEYILNAVKNSGKVLFMGKIIGIERKLFKGHIWGEVTIEHSKDKDEKLIIPFKNENIYAKLINEKKNTSSVLASVPDLIAVIESETGEAIGTPEYRYGLHVFVLGIRASDKWTQTERGIKIGGPKGFDLDDVEYIPIVPTYDAPLSVIDEFGV